VIEEKNGFRDKLQELDACVCRLNGCISFLEMRTAEHQRLLLSVRELLKRTLELRTKVKRLAAEPEEMDMPVPLPGSAAMESSDAVERLLSEIDQEWKGLNKGNGLEPELR